MSESSLAHAAVARSVARRRTGQALSASAPRRAPQSFRWSVSARRRRRQAGSGQTTGAGSAGSESRRANTGSVMRPRARSAIVRTRASVCRAPSTSARSVESRRSSATRMRPMSAESVAESGLFCASVGVAIARSAMTKATPPCARSRMMNDLNGSSRTRCSSSPACTRRSTC